MYWRVSAAILFFSFGCVSLSEHEKLMNESELKLGRVISSYNKEKANSFILYEELKVQKKRIDKLSNENSSYLVEKLKFEEQALQLDKELRLSKKRAKEKESLLAASELKIKELNDSVKDWKESIVLLQKKITLLESELLVKNKAKRKFVCKGFDCYRAAVKGSDKFWDMYSSIAFEFLGRSVHRKELEKERKRVLREWKKTKQWVGDEVVVSVDWVTGDRKTYMNLSFRSHYGSSYPDLNDVKIEILKKRDMEFANDVSEGMYDVYAYFSTRIKKTASRFWGKTTYHKEIVVSIKRIEFVPNTEDYKWGKVPKNKVYKRFISKDNTYYIN